MNFDVPDNLDRWERHQAEQERRLERLPECSCCGEKVQEDYYFEINGEVLCVHCLNEYYRKDIEDYVG